MLYPMVQHIALVCVEIEKKMPPQGLCPLSSSSSSSWKSKIILARRPAPTKIGMSHGRSPWAQKQCHINKLFKF
jgi:hypothetical protein